VLMGNRSTGLQAADDEIWNQGTPFVAGTVNSGERFGYALAIGVRYDEIDNRNGGAANVLYGTGGDGLSFVGNELWHQNVDGIAGGVEANDEFGFALASGDFNNDGADDLAIGVPGEAIGSVADAGAVNVIYGALGEGLVSAGDRMFHANSAGIPGAVEANDRFGSSLAAGDVDGDGYDDLVIGVPLENIGAVVDAGAVIIIHGSGSGLNGADSRSIIQGNLQFPGEVSAYARFGWALVVEDFDGDALQDLAISALGRYGAGPLDSVSVLYQQPYIPMTIIGDGFE